MSVPVEVWLHGDDFARSAAIEGVAPNAQSWTDGDVRAVLEGMLVTMHRLKHASTPDRAVTLRGLSWIVNAFEGGGVVIAIEITMGAAVAGPLDIDELSLHRMIARVLASYVDEGSTAVH
jgi:hypothetical protein